MLKFVFVQNRSMEIYKLLSTQYVYNCGNDPKQVRPGWWSETEGNAVPDVPMVMQCIGGSVNTAGDAVVGSYFH